MTSEGLSAPEGPRLPLMAGQSGFGKAERKLLKRRGHRLLLPQGKATLWLTTSLEFHVQGHGLLSPALTNPALRDGA